MEYTRIICLVLLAFVNASAVMGWGYRASDQRRWSRHHGACAGRQQSPIAVSTRRSIPIYMPAVEMVGYHNPLPGPLTITNNGHSVTLTIPKYTNEEIERGARMPYIFGGRLESEYELEGLHFHWGDKNNRGSEHLLNDVRMPMEMHIIHRNKKYRTMSEALENPDGLTVLGFFYQVVEEESKALGLLARNLTTIEQYNSNMTLPQTFSLSMLLEGLDTDRFYTYKGSLTTPPCSEAVTWVLFPDPLPVSVYQMEKFRLLSTSTNLSLVDNFRHLQPLYGRRVFSRMTSRHPKYNYYSKLHYSKWDWFGPSTLKYQDNEPPNVDCENDAENFND